jgi:hypothetical protein
MNPRPCSTLSIESPTLFPERDHTTRRRNPSGSSVTKDGCSCPLFMGSSVLDRRLGQCSGMPPEHAGPRRFGLLIRGLRREVSVVANEDDSPVCENFESPRMVQRPIPGTAQAELRRRPRFCEGHEGRSDGDVSDEADSCLARTFDASADPGAGDEASGAARRAFGEEAEALTELRLLDPRDGSYSAGSMNGGPAVNYSVGAAAAGRRECDRGKQNQTRQALHLMKDTTLRTESSQVLRAAGRLHWASVRECHPTGVAVFSRTAYR